MPTLTQRGLGTCSRQNWWEQNDGTKQAQQAQARYEQLLVVETNVRAWENEWRWDPTRLDLLDRAARAHLQAGDLGRAEQTFQRLQTWARDLRAEPWEGKAKRALEGLRRVR